MLASPSASIMFTAGSLPVLMRASYLPLRRFSVDIISPPPFVGVYVIVPSVTGAMFTVPLAFILQQSVGEPAFIHVYFSILYSSYSLNSWAVRGAFSPVPAFEAFTGFPLSFTMSRYLMYSPGGM